jgi:hypothetical protein
VCQTKPAGGCQGHETAGKARPCRAATCRSPPCRRTLYATGGCGPSHRLLRRCTGRTICCGFFWAHRNGFFEAGTRVAARGPPATMGCHFALAAWRCILEHWRRSCPAQRSIRC